MDEQFKNIALVCASCADTKVAEAALKEVNDLRDAYESLRKNFDKVQMALFNSSNWAKDLKANVDELIKAADEKIAKLEDENKSLKDMNEDLQKKLKEAQSALYVDVAMSVEDNPDPKGWY